MSVETPKDWERDILNLADRIARSDDQTRRILWDGVTHLIHQVEEQATTETPKQLAKLLIIRRHIEQMDKLRAGGSPSAPLSLCVPPAGACFFLNVITQRYRATLRKSSRRDRRCGA
jgi:hypothetical protein